MKACPLRTIVASLCLFVVGAFAQDETSTKTLNLRGSVKKVDTYWLVPQDNGGKVADKRQISEELLFDSHGRVVQRTFYATEELPTREKHIYDKNGRRVLGEYYGGYHRADLDAPWESSEEYLYKYNRAGMVAEQLELDKQSKTPVKRIALWYDDRGNMTESSLFYAGDETPAERNVYTYDKLNRRTSAAKYDRDGKLKSRTTWAFDWNGLVSEEIAEGEDYKGRVKTSYSYDQRNRLLLKETVDTGRNKEIVRTVHNYDDAKRTEEVLNYCNGVLFTKAVTQFDQFGNVLARLETMTDDAKKLMAEIANRPSNGQVPLEAGALAALSGMFAREAFTYEYDSRGNWIKRVEYAATEFEIGKDNPDAELKPVRTQVRVISYATDSIANTSKPSRPSGPARVRGRSAENRPSLKRPQPRSDSRTKIARARKDKKAARH